MTERKSLEIGITRAGKIAGREPVAFSLPAETCIGRTPACDDCYTEKGKCALPTTQSAWKRNLISLVRSKFQALDQIPLDAEIFRIHISGDFFNQRYIDAWINTIKSRPNTKFWVYTRSFRLDFSELVKLPNLVLFLSVDQYNQKQAHELNRKLNGKARLAFSYQPHDISIPKSLGIICPATNGQMEVDSACKRCGYCYRKEEKRAVVFIKH